MTGVEYGLKDSSFKKTVCMCYGGGGDGVNNKHNRPEYSNTAVDIYIINKIMKFHVSI